MTLRRLLVLASLASGSAYAAPRTVLAFTAGARITLDTLLAPAAKR